MAVMMHVIAMIKGKPKTVSGSDRSLPNPMRQSYSDRGSLNSDNSV